MICKSVWFNAPVEFVARFILTMWYVNISNFILFMIKLYRFILTMWYVNGGTTGDGVTDAGTSFILTMWYVNSISILLSIENLLVLY